MKFLTKKSFLYGVAVFLSATIFLSFTVSNELIFDDEGNVKNNKVIGSFKNIPSFFVTNIYHGEKEFDPLYRPIFLASLALNRIIFGNSPYAYHITNLLLHALAVTLLYILFAQFLGYNYRSLIPALLFAVHPIHVDAVAFVFNRSEILALIFLSLSLIVLLNDSDWKNFFLGRATVIDRKNNYFNVLISSLLFFAALLSKETAAAYIVTLFLVAALLYKDRRSLNFSKKKIFIALIIFSTIFLVYISIRYFAVGGIGAEGWVTIFPERKFSVVFPTMSRVFKDYIFLLIAPISLRVNYADYALSKSIFEMQAVLSYIVHLAILGLAIGSFKKCKLVSISIFSFYIFLLPVSHIFPFLDIKAERFLYIPSVFFVVLMAYPLNLIRSDHKNHRSLIFIMSGLFLFYGILTLNYSTLFKSEISLWYEMVNKAPRNVKFQYNLGLRLWKEHRNEEAIICFENVLRLDKKFLDAYAPLAVSYVLVGNEEKAQKLFLDGLRLNPNHFLLNVNYATFCYLRKEYEKAYYHIKKAEQISPDDPHVQKAIGEISNKARETSGDGDGLLR